MNHYRDYILSRERLEAIERPEGFLLWRFDEKPEPHLFISDYYVSPEHRQKGIGYEMAREAFAIAKDNGIGIAMCQCDKMAANWELSYFTIKNFGFKKCAEANGVITLFMEIE